ncbi:MULTISPECIES: S1 family peptidase [Vibrio]|uniref:S1 family peptidase n=1 Tax=Vibrio TaxID=662 RepID=UPI00076A6451|nr:MULTISPECIES: serine protease [Vibrio]
MNLNDISTQLLFTTTPIKTAKNDGSESIGTGFFYNKPHPTNKELYMPMLITNKHVVEGAKEGIIQMYRSTSNGEPITEQRITITLDESFFKSFIVDSEYDLAAIPITGVFELAAKNGDNLFYRALDDSLFPSDSMEKELSALEDIIFIGYPSGIVDSKTGLPLIRQGITSSPVWSSFESKNQFLIDAGVFPGSSGSPVFIYNNGSYPSNGNLVVGSRVLLVGVIYQTMQTGEKAYLGLGKVINQKEIKRFVDSIR